jgi:CheY-like chemotaxis protein
MAAPRGPIVLVVEDQPPQRALLAETLTEAGYEVEEAWNGEEAITAVERLLARRGRLGLILLDMKLPYRDGLDVLRHLATTGAPVPVVAISAHDDLLAAATGEGAAGTLPKPFDLNELLAAVANHWCSPAS